LSNKTKGIGSVVAVGVERILVGVGIGVSVGMGVKNAVGKYVSVRAYVETDVITGVAVDVQEVRTTIKKADSN